MQYFFKSKYTSKSNTTGTLLKSNSSADLDTQLMQLKRWMESRTITRMPYKDKNSIVVMLCFMSRTALGPKAIYTH